MELKSLNFEWMTDSLIRVRVADTNDHTYTSSVHINSGAEGGL